MLPPAAEVHEANASCPAQSLLALRFIASGPRLAFSTCQAGAPTPVQPRDLRCPWGAWTPKRSRRALASLPQSGAQRGERRTARPMPAGSSFGGGSPRPPPAPEAAGRGRSGPARCRPLRGPPSARRRAGAGAGPGPAPCLPTWEEPGAGRVQGAGCRRPRRVGPLSLCRRVRDSAGQRRHGPGTPSPASRKCLPERVGERSGAGGGASRSRAGTRGAAAGGARSAARLRVAAGLGELFFPRFQVIHLGDFFFFLSPLKKPPPSISGTL